jgi:hypothetical protein
MDSNTIAGALLTLATFGAVIFIYRAKPGLGRRGKRVDLEDE